VVAANHLRQLDLPTERLAAAVRLRRVHRRHPRIRSGIIVGVIGGYQEGGDTAAVSYSFDLGAEIQRLYQQAVADEA
jgi:hypothetical protein